MERKVSFEEMLDKYEINEKVYVKRKYCYDIEKTIRVQRKKLRYIPHKDELIHVIGNIFMTYGEMKKRN